MVFGDGEIVQCDGGEPKDPECASATMAVRTLREHQEHVAATVGCLGGMATEQSAAGTPTGVDSQSIDESAGGDQALPEGVELVEAKVGRESPRPKRDVPPSSESQRVVRTGEGVEQASGSSEKLPPLKNALLAEAIGVALIVMFICGSVIVAVTTRSSAGLWPIAVVSGLGVALAIMTTADVSGAHLNPAVTLAFLLVRPGSFPRSRVLPYWAAQLAGGIAGGAINLLLYGPAIAHYEEEEIIVRGEPGSHRTAMFFGEYFPAPGAFGPNAEEANMISHFRALCTEAFGTALLCFVVFAVTHPRARVGAIGPGPGDRPAAPFCIGFVVACMLAMYAPLTQAGWNPARDFGPRITAAIAGWGTEAIPGPRWGFWVYIVGPLIGGPLGALLFDAGLAPALVEKQERAEKLQQASEGSAQRARAEVDASE